MASRVIEGALESKSLASLNAITDPCVPSVPSPKRRKISHDNETSLLSPTQRTLTIKGHATSFSNNEITLVTLALLPRWALPLSWLDSTTAVQSNNIFASNDGALQGIFSPVAGAEGRGSEPTVLASRSLSNNALYVIELVKNGVYSISKLQSNIGEGEIRVTAKAAAAAAAAMGSSSIRNWTFNPDPASLESSFKHQSWKEIARLPDDRVKCDTGLVNCKGDVSVAFEDFCHVGHGGEDKNSQPCFRDGDTTINGLTDKPQQHYRTPQGEAVLEAEENTPDITPLTPDDVLDNLRNQYLEALYISKTSVAYFAKGPLARCRNAFTQYRQDNDVPSLASQYRESILSVKKMDAKYRESVPVILRNMNLLLSDDEGRKARKSKRKKKKPGKNGLYTGEEEFLQRYWKSRQVPKRHEDMEESKDEEIKRHISDLRLRETQLQILLILETIHLETTDVTPAITETSDHGMVKSSTKKSKSKKNEDLAILLELFIDRLCIWHAISAGDGLIVESLQETTNAHLSGKKVENDALQDFCNEVIIPFYASRLPAQCKIIKKKLGGPSEISPSRPVVSKSKSSISSASAARNKSNATGDKRAQVQQKPRRTLQRVLTDEQASNAQRNRHPSLIRSSTTPALREVSRESLEPLLPSLGGSVRGGIQVSRRVDKREVDLNAVAKVHEAKLKKMNALIEQKKELDLAITALRKPNRELVSKEIAEQAEKRTSSSSRKCKNPVRNPLGQGVQVMATPRGTRKKDMSVAQQFQPHKSHEQGLSRLSPVGQQATANDISPELTSDASFVPGSSVRTSVLHDSVASKRKFDSITETPSRSSSRRPDPMGIEGDHENALMSTPVPVGSSIPCTRALFKMPTLPKVPGRSMESSGKQLDHDDQDFTISIEQTPPAKSRIFYTRDLSRDQTRKPRVSPVPGLETPAVRGGALTAQKKEDLTQTVQSTPVKSIYEELGWEDGDDDELAL